MSQLNSVRYYNVGSHSQPAIYRFYPIKRHVKSQRSVNSSKIQTHAHTQCLQWFIQEQTGCNHSLWCNGTSVFWFLRTSCALIFLIMPTFHPTQSFLRRVSRTNYIQLKINKTDLENWLNLAVWCGTEITATSPCKHNFRHAHFDTNTVHVPTI